MLPNNLTESIALSQQAVRAAIADGNLRCTVELKLADINDIPELRGVDIARTFLAPFGETYGNTLKVFLADTGAAALARRDWTEATFKITDLGSSRSPIADKIQAEDEIFIAIEPSAVEVEQIEKLCELAGDRPVILFLPKLEDAALLGIGYAARQLRDRLIKKLYPAYYIKPLADAAIYRCHPGQWQVWREEAEDYTLVAELDRLPVGDELDEILNPTTTSDGDSTTAPKSRGILAGLGRFVRTLSKG
jgi:GAF domain-containing protein